MNILITGCAGFIGNAFALKILKTNKMIKYTLKCKSIYCSNQNTFDGWFQNMESFEKQKSKDLILCPLCGSDDIIKSLSISSEAPV